jgi:hypothetical protein
MPAATPVAGETQSPVATPGTETSPIAPPASESADELAEETADQALAWLAGEAGVIAADLRLVTAERAEWTDSCFGLGGPAESCLAAITPGWRIVFEAGGQQYEVRTDEAGSNFRLAPQDSGSAGELAQEIADQAVAWLAGEAGVTAADLRVVTAERAEWTDSCFGLGGPAESCLAAMTPGWRIVFEAGGQQYEVRTDEAGSNFRLAPQGS